jgi:two-component system, LytTR family, response regulator
LDDELQGLTYLKLLCEQIPELEIVRAYNDPNTFLKDFPAIECDLCILDIEMPGLNGLEVTSLLKGKPVIFVTAYKEYALDAFELDAVDYLQKPVQPERLELAIQKAVKRIESNYSSPKYIQLNTDRGRALIYFDQLVYVKTSEIDSRDKTTLLENGTVLQLKNIAFEKLISLLPPDEFCRINKRELIALSRILYSSNDQITTNIYFQSEKPMVLTLGGSYRTEFMRKLNR